MPLHYYRTEFKAMGTLCEIQLFAPTPGLAEQVAQAAIADVQRLEARYSRYLPDSFLSAINRVAAVGGSIWVDDETASLLDYADTCHQQSDGLFDISSGILREAWQFGQNTLPDANVVAALQAKVGWHKVHWRRPELAFSVAGMALDFGGIVKEYAADRAAALCYGLGISHAVINLGGDIKVLGPRADGSAWRVGIRHPNAAQGLLHNLLLKVGAVASSGDYERCIRINGTRYGHILNPNTGWPVRHLVAVSVVADYCVVAGSAATIAMLKEEQGKAWLMALGLPHLWVDVEGQVGGTLAGLGECG